MIIGFIGLGVMGEPMCRNVARKSGHAVSAYDLDPAPLARLAADGVAAVGDLSALAAADVVMLVLPSGRHVAGVCEALLPLVRPGQIVVDLGTSPVALTRDLAGRFAARGARYADAPIARTRQAAEDGTLSIMVGAEAALFDTLRPLLACMAAEITHCGPVGHGQIAKIMNNMVLIQTVVALSEAKAVAERNGMDAGLLFETLARGSADSFALRNHGMKAIVPDRFPERAFSTDYALKDLLYALKLAEEAGLALPGARVAEAALRRAIAEGWGGLYWPVIARAVR